MTSLVTPIIENCGDSLRITLSMRDPRISKYLRIFLTFWLMGWACGEISVINILLTGKVSVTARAILAEQSFSISLPVWLKNFIYKSFFLSADAWFKDFDFVFVSLSVFLFLFLCLWLVLWTFGGISYLYIFLKELTGKEIIEVNSQSITVHRQVLNFSLPTQEYMAEKIKDLRILPVSASSDANSYLWEETFGKHGMGPIAFNCGTITIRFGVSTDETQAKQIVATIGQRFPQYER